LKILLLSHNFGGGFDPRGYRWRSIVSYLVEKGHKVDVLTYGFGAWSDQDGVTVYSVCRSPTKPNSVGKLTKIDKYFRFQIRVLRAFLQTIIWPDGAVRWLPSYYALGRKLLSSTDYDFMISSSHPFTIHLVGLLLKKTYPFVPWGVDCGDPFFLLKGQSRKNRFLFDWLSFNIEKKIYKLSHSVYFTFSGCVELHRKHFPQFRDKFFEIPHLLSDENLTKLESNIQFQERFVFGYFGGWHLNIREPVKVIKFFTENKDIIEATVGKFCVVFYGGGNIADLFGQILIDESIFQIHKRVDKFEALNMMRRCNILINVGNSSDTQLPSKVVDYFAANRPIMNFITSSTDTSSEFFAKHDLNSLDICMSGDSAMLNDSDVRILFDGCKPSSPNLDAFKIYGVSVVADNYLANIV